MELRVDMIYTGEQEDTTVPMFSMKDGAVEPLSVSAKEDAATGISIDGESVLFPSDGMKFMDALQIVYSGAYARATAPYAVK